MIGIILILIGIWSVWTSYKDGTIQHNTVVVIDGIRRIVTSLFSDEADKSRINRRFEEFESFIAGTNIPNPGRTEHEHDI